MMHKNGDKAGIKIRIKNPLFFLAGVVMVVATGAWLRFVECDERPLHFDESVQARILADRLEQQAHPFDPAHFHGPLLSLSAQPIARLRGEESWSTLTAPTLRFTAALFGLMTVVAAMGMRSSFGAGAGLASAAFIATSPLLAYYSRMFIHEPVFVLFGLVSVLTLYTFLERPRFFLSALLGWSTGLMAATRETVVISLLVWTVATFIWLRLHHADSFRSDRIRHVARIALPHLLVAGLVGFAVTAFVYSDFLRHPRGVVDFFTTFFVYRPQPGHEKPFAYYVNLMMVPKWSGGVWWTEVGILFFAVMGSLITPAGRGRQASRFFCLAGLLHILIYSVIPYKTPWLMALGWTHVCLAAGIGSARWMSVARGRWRVLAVGLVAMVLCWHTVQSYRAVFRFASDPRNPYAYVPTSTDLVRWVDWLEELSVRHPELRADPVAVVGPSYWPLPWYLRGFDRVGYLDVFPENAAALPLLLVLSPNEPEQLEQTHMLFPRGLRDDVLVTVAIRNDVWEKEVKGAVP